MLNLTGVKGTPDFVIFIVLYPKRAIIPSIIFDIFYQGQFYRKLFVKWSLTISRGVLRSIVTGIVM